MRQLLHAALAMGMLQTAAATDPNTADTVLSAYRAATGNIPTTGTAQLNYVYADNGLQGSRTLNVDLQTGAFVEATQADIISNGEGFDGKIPWMRDTSGANTAQEGGDRIPCAISAAYRNANLWWRPDHGGATVEYVGRQTLAGRPLDQLNITPHGGKPFGAWFDVNTHLLVSITQERQFFHTRTSLEDYRSERGMLLPHTVTVDVGTGADDIEHLRLTSISVGVAHPLSFYSRPTAPPTGAAIVGGGTTVTVPFRLLNNHIYLSATVNGKGPYTFLLDTGGHNLLSPQLVAELGLKSVGAEAMSGAGEKTSAGGFARVEEIGVGQVRLRNQLGFVVQIYDPSVEGIRVDGMVGFELLRRFAVQIDYGGNKITFTEPSHFESSGAGTAIPFVFYDHLPFVQGMVGNLPARFDIDTGSRSEVDLTGPFVKAHDLRRQFSKGINAVTGWGMGGPSRSYVVRLPSLTLGSVRVSSLVAGLSQDKGGSMSDPSYDGNIGGGLLKRFVVTFDYAHQVMYLKPASPAPLDAGRFDRSGMWINAAAEGYVVTEVSPGGPAAKAGIAVGDIITRMEGAPVRFDELSATRVRLRSQAVGTQVAMQVKRAGQVKAVHVVLQDSL